MFEQKIRDTSGISMFLFRAALFLAFLLMAGRLYQLQIVQGDSYRARADDNRFTLIEMPAPRGVIYDRSGEILTRNRPSFEIGVVPEDLPYNDPATEEDEEALEIARVLRLVGADTDEETALRIAELLFLRLGRVDYARTVGEAGVQLTYITVPPGTVGDSGGRRAAARRGSARTGAGYLRALPLPGLVVGAAGGRHRTAGQRAAAGADSGLVGSGQRRRGGGGLPTALGSCRGGACPRSRDRRLDEPYSASWGRFRRRRRRITASEATPTRTKRSA